MKAFLSCLICVLLIGTLTACPYRVRRAVVVEKVVEVVATPIVAVPVVVTAYGASYVPPAPAPVPAVAAPIPAAAAPGPSPCEKELAALRAEMTALRQEIRGGKPTMPRADAPAPAAAPNGARGETVFRRACAACHSDTAPLKSFEAASKLHLFAGGKFVPPDARVQLKIFKRVGRDPSSPGAMPPKDSGIAPLSEQEAVDLGEYLDALKE